MTKRTIFRALGYLFCLLPPVLAILEHFPLWAREGGKPMLSGIALLLLLVAVIPLRRGLRVALRAWLSSPSAWTVWGVLWLLTEWLGRISVAVADIALCGTVSSLIGALFFRLSRGKRHEG